MVLRLHLVFGLAALSLPLPLDLGNGVASIWGHRSRFDDGTVCSGWEFQCRHDHLCHCNVLVPQNQSKWQNPEVLTSVSVKDGSVLPVRFEYPDRLSLALTGTTDL